MDTHSIIATKRDGGALSEAEIAAFIKGYVNDEITEYHASALLMAIYIHGMQPDELTAWTRAMLHSGRTMRFDDIDRPKVDKHSTGGVGDKASIPLAPAVAACGLSVPMVSGRGLGHTGGTLDKLESIPGVVTKLNEERFGSILRAHGLAFGGQTEDLVPADRKLYALRDATGLVASVPLIASSIMSKKLAEGIDALVLDVKFGSGAFLPSIQDGKELAKVMLSIAKGMDVEATAYMTNMHRPLGRTAGHTLEILECLDCLKGDGPRDLRELVLTLGGEMLLLGKLVATRKEGEERVARSLDDGSALQVFYDVIAAQGGDVSYLENPDKLESAPDVEILKADRDGCFRWTSSREVGLGVCSLGGGRVRLEDVIDNTVGFRFLRQGGENVKAGDELVEIHHRKGRGLEAAHEHLARAFQIGAEFTPEPLVQERITS